MTMRASLVWIFTLLLFYSCATSHSSPRFYAKKLKKEIGNSPVFARSFTGFTLLDPETGKILCDVNGGHYFTPASTAKILTLATCLAVLGDSVPGMRIWAADTSLYFRGTGDPTFLHTKFRAWQQIAGRLNHASQKSIIWVSDPEVKGLGPGWAWDDTSYPYSAERSTLPVFGNTERIYAVRSDSLSAEPGLVRIRKADEGYLDYGLLGDNTYLLYGTKEIYPPDYEQIIPIKSVSDWNNYGYNTLDLLEKGLHRRLFVAEEEEIDSVITKPYFYSTPLDTVLRRMMYQSDNFIAEQMLIVCNGVKYDTLAQNKIIEWAKDSLFPPPITNTPITNNQQTNSQTTNNQAPRWVDGSGLSRYNLVTPQYFTGVLRKLWQEQNHDRLLQLFPTAGAPETTLDWWQPAPATPWLYAKTGSMSGVQCMSGYLRTKSGKILIFSFMHNNFVGSGKPWRLEMQRVLELVR